MWLSCARLPGRSTDHVGAKTCCGAGYGPFASFASICLSVGLSVCAFGMVSESGNHHSDQHGSAITAALSFGGAEIHYLTSAGKTISSSSQHSSSLLIMCMQMPPNLDSCVCLSAFNALRFQRRPSRRQRCGSEQPL